MSLGAVIVACGSSSSRSRSSSGSVVVVVLVEKEGYGPFILAKRVGVEEFGQTNKKYEITQLHGARVALMRLTNTTKLQIHAGMLHTQQECNLVWTGAQKETAMALLRGVNGTITNLLFLTGSGTTYTHGVQRQGRKWE